ncbi:MAG: glycosyltransferase family 4 protein [Acidimicrobiales bacterium]|nr:glycosyltransferase family 4 protein [Acidimicrobiales bacterium]
MKIGMVAPPWVPVPPKAYGGTELVVDALCVSLQRAGHEVTLFTTADSTCAVRRRHLFAHSDPDRMGSAVLELRHVAAAYDELEQMDIIHDHTLAGMFYRDAPNVPVVVTNHGPFNADLADLYGRVAGRIPVIAISRDQASRAPDGLPIAAVIHHGLLLDRYPFAEHPADHLLFLGRMSPDKGIDSAIRTARRAGTPLLIAAKMREANEVRYFEETIRPMLSRSVRYIGEADFASKVRLLSSARALINPIQWPEPFGLVMAEALACGTPVVGYPGGAAPEIVDHGVTGFLVDDEDELVDAVSRIDQINRGVCREVAEEKFTAARMAADHLRLYRDVIGKWGSRHSNLPTSEDTLTRSLLALH